MASKKSGIDKTTFFDLISHQALVPNDDAELQLHLEETIDAIPFMRRLHEWPSENHLDNMSPDEQSAQMKLDGESLLKALHLHPVSDGEVSEIRELKRNTEDKPLH